MGKISVRQQSGLNAIPIPADIFHYIQNSVSFLGAQNEAIQYIETTGDLRNQYANPETYQDGYVIVGPPGTGKTFVICTGSIKFLKNQDDLRRSQRNRRAQVVITTFTNAAAERVISCFEDIFDASSIPQSDRTILLGRLIADEGLFDRTNSYHILTRKPSFMNHTEWNEVREKADCRRIFVGTVYAVRQAFRGRIDGLKIIQPSLILFDEASQLNVSKINLAFHRANERLNGIGLVGDPAQLGPIARIRELQNGSISVLMGLDGGTVRIQRVVQLNYQRRMHPIIRGLSDIYGNYIEPIRDDISTLTLNLGEKNESINIPSTFIPIFDDDNRIILFDDSEHPDVSEIEVGTSRINYFEANFAIFIARLFRNVFLELTDQEIIIIVPYAEQVSILQHSEFRVGTVDTFQGQEAKLVIASTIRTDGDAPLSFVADQNRLNVLVSRAQSKLILINHRQVFQNNALFQALYSYLEENSDQTIILDLDENLVDSLNNWSSEIS